MTPTISFLDKVVVKDHVRRDQVRRKDNQNAFNLTSCELCADEDQIK
jgi:hypothetical protein